MEICLISAGTSLSSYSIYFYLFLEDGSFPHEFSILIYPKLGTWKPRNLPEVSLVNFPFSSITKPNEECCWENVWGRDGWKEGNYLLSLIYFSYFGNVKSFSSYTGSKWIMIQEDCHEEDSCHFRRKTILCDQSMKYDVPKTGTNWGKGESCYLTAKCQDLLYDCKMFDASTINEDTALTSPVPL